MFRRPRQRRGPYALAPTTPVSPRFVRGGAVVAIVLTVFIVGRWTLRAMGIGNSVQRAAALLVIDDGAQASVALDGGALKRADDVLKLYAGDRVSSTSGRFSLAFFDGTVLRAEAGTDLTVRDSARGAQSSAIDIRLAKGSVWVKTPTAASYTGSILRTLQTTSLALTLPSNTEAIATDNSLAVFSADGLGVSADVDGYGSVVIGEGQEFSVPGDDEEVVDLYAHRSPLTAQTLGSAFLTNSRAIAAHAANQPVEPVVAVEDTGDLLTITEPVDGATVTARTVRVSGKVGEGVSKVRVNGYQASLDSERRTFTQELALPDSEEAEIRVEALDARGLTLQESRRTLHRDIQPPPPPAITQPAANGTTYRTNSEEFELRGTAPTGVAGILVNDYRLQLFKKGNTEWSYLASVRLGNAVRGKNVFTVKAIDDDGNPSEPVTVTILIEEGAEGIVDAGEASSLGTASAASSQSSIDVASLPKNAPLKPGSVVVTGPAAGTSYTLTGTELLLEGTSPPEAASFWVNDYKLQLFNPAKQTWTYIAREEWGTVKPGTNTYVVTARDAEGKILDSVTYTVEKK